MQLPFSLPISPELLLYSVLVIAILLAGTLLAKFISGARYVNQIKKFRVLIMQKRPQGYVKIKQKTVPADVSEFHYRDKTYIIDSSRVAYFNPHPVLLYDYEKAEPLPVKIDAAGNQIHADTVNQLLRRKVVQQLVAAVRTQKQDLAMIVMAALLGLVGGIVIGQFIHFPAPSGTTVVTTTASQQTTVFPPTK